MSIFMFNFASVINQEKEAMKNLQETIKRLNERILNNAMILKRIEMDENNRKFDWAKGEDSGIEGTDTNGRFKI